MTMNRTGRQEWAAAVIAAAFAFCTFNGARAQTDDGTTEKQAADLTLKAKALSQNAQFAEATALFEKALALRQMLYPGKDYPRGHVSLVTSLNNLAGALKSQRDYARSLSYYDQALAMCRKLYPVEEFPDGHPGLAGTLNNLAALQQAQGDYSKAQLAYELALAMCRKLYPAEKYPQGHANLTVTLSNLADLLRAKGEYAEALVHFEEALKTSRKLYPSDRFPQGHQNIVNNLESISQVLEIQGDVRKALAYQEEALAMSRQLYPADKYPNGHPGLARCLNNLGSLFHRQGEYAKALAQYEQAEQMCRKLYAPEKFPHGHGSHAATLNNLAEVRRSQREYAKALAYQEQAFAIMQRLYASEQYPRGTPNLVVAFFNMGGALKDVKDYDKALPYYDKALTTARKLYPEQDYPQGHPLLLACLNNLGSLLEAQQKYKEALGYYGQALTMAEHLYPGVAYPQGHPDFARVLENAGGMWLLHGKYAKAQSAYERALLQRRQLATLFIDTAAEAEALNYLAALPRSLDVYLSIGKHLKEDAVEREYPTVWSGKAMLTRIVQRRQALVRGLADDATRAKVAEVLDVRQQLGRRLLAPADRKDAERSKHLQALTERKERLERELAQRVPALERERSLDQAPFTDLLKALPKDAAFIDLVRYERREQDPKERRLHHYAAFVLRANQPVRRVELGPAQPIEEALVRWRRDIANNLTGLAPEQLRRLLWDPLVRHLPDQADSTVYISPDGPLGFLPWAALPGRRPNSVLLEDHSIALVPHGPFLLDLLTRDRKARGGEFLAVGGVDYDKEPRALPERPAAGRAPAEPGARARWDALPGTERELQHIRALAGKLTVIERRGSDASTLQILRDLPQARWAHLATHGFFAAPRSAERQALIDERFFTLGRGGERHGVGARNPLVQTGLVLAGANRPSKQDLLQDDRGILTAEAIAGLPLDGLELVVLSACETGLGEAAAGEGVFGLQRAFHLAGTSTVIASLWKVDDEATAALMALFYHHLWVEKRSPREALRRAQLALYHHPEEISGLAKERGPNFDKVVKRVVGAPVDPKQPQAKQAAVRQWAAFALSGG
jgi:CHAT domain-containing protein/tetratricopeptide (TPR) repeat protein